MTVQPSNPWFGVSMVLVGVIVGYGVAMGTGGGLIRPSAQIAPSDAKPSPSPTAQGQTYDDLIPFDPSADYYKGNPSATLALIEYSDYECPFCQRHHPTMQQALDEYSDDVVWVYRHYPLSFHANAKPAAEAAECVGEIGGNEKFWEFSDLVFEQGSEVAKYAGYAQQIGVNQTELQNCIDSGKYSEKVDQQLAQGTTAGVRGTPGTFVTNTKTGETQYISGAQPYTNVKAIIDGML